MLTNFISRAFKSPSAIHPSQRLTAPLAALPWSSPIPHDEPRLSYHQQSIPPATTSPPPPNNPPPVPSMAPVVLACLATHINTIQCIPVLIPLRMATHILPTNRC